MSRAIGRPQRAKRRASRPRRYDQEVLKALTQIWYVFDFMCGNRLVVVLRTMLPVLESFGEIPLAAPVCDKLLSISAATIDRLLQDERARLRLKGRSHTKPGSLLKHQIPVCTFADWDEQEPGFFEIDLLAHDGGDASGEYCQTLTTMGFLASGHLQVYNRRRMDSTNRRSNVAKPLRIVSVGAHPADIFDQSGGTMAHHAGRGDFVAGIALTHGVRVHDAVISVEMSQREEVPDSTELRDLMRQRAEVKVTEVRAACEILGITAVHFFGADDGVLLVTDEAVRRLARLLRELRPDAVLTHFPKEGDGLTNTHAVGGQIVMHALALAAAVDPGDRRPPHRVASVFFFGMGAAKTRSKLWDAEGGYYNDVFIDITDVVDKKLAALDCLVSQGYGGAYARKRIETADGAFGVAGNCSYAEGFISSTSQTYHHLPISDHTLLVAHSTDHENLARSSHRIRVD